MLYRFRNTARLLEDNELKDQYLYFAAPLQQNDPMEGHVEFIWKGDLIAWLGLFKHYVWQIFMVLTMIDLPLEQLQQLFLNHTEIYWKDTRFPEMRVELENEFAEDTRIRDLSTILDQYNMVISAGELRAILKMLHGIALRYANRAVQRWYPSLFANPNWIDQVFPASLVDHGLNTFINALRNGAILSAMAKLVNSITDVSTLNAHITVNRRNYPGNTDITLFLLYEFPQIYVERISWLAFPDWYCVCFSSDVSNPAQWGYYADGHKGVCLLFQNSPSGGLSLTSMAKPNRPRKEFRQFQKVNYGTLLTEVDFFNCLGRLWGDERSHWFRHKGEMSRCEFDMLSNETLWQKQYRKNSMDRLLRKSAAWSAEQEYRIILDDSWTVHSTNEQRKYYYEFSDLEGIAFGIKTPLEKKLQIIDIIRNKCNAQQRNHFNFYQATYTPQTSSIKLIPIPISLI